MVRKIKRLRKSAIILLILVIIATIGWLVYRAFGPMVQEVWQILQSGNQSELAEYIQGQGHYGAYIALFMISVGLDLLLVMYWCLRYCVAWVNLSVLR